LSHSSRPSNKLSGTCAGIASMDTLAQPIRIAVSKPADAGTTAPNPAERLELLFGRTKRRHRYRLKFDGEYGEDEGGNPEDDRLEFCMEYGVFRGADSTEPGTSTPSCNLQGITAVNSPSASSSG